ncbi:MAG: hypothetical protein WA002_15165, partial [Candidatus Acidiferrales bacterium]
MRGESLRLRGFIWLVALACAPVLAGGCAHISKKRNIPAAQVRPLLNATKPDLIEKYERQAHAIQSLNATVTLSPKAGSAYS